MTRKEPLVPLWENLVPSCEFSGRDVQCDDPAARRVSWDDGKTWLYLCEKHAREVEESGS